MATQTVKATVKVANVPLRGKMKKVIRDEAKALALVGGQFVTNGKIVKELTTEDGGYEDVVVVCKSPGHCAVGALMYAAGIPNKTIRLYQDSAVSSGVARRIRQKMFDTYHIDPTDEGEIISANDSIGEGLTVSSYTDSVQTRLETVLKTIDSLPKRKRFRP